MDYITLQLYPIFTLDERFVDKPNAVVYRECTWIQDD